MRGKQVLKEWARASAAAGLTALGAARRGGGLRAFDPAAVRSILVIRLNLLGDLLFTLPAIAALRKSFPAARITAVILPYAGDVLQASCLADRVVMADVNRWRHLSAWAAGRAPGEFQRALSDLRQQPYDLGVSFYGRPGAACALLSGAGFLAGYGSEGYPFSFDLVVPGRRYSVRRHEVEYCLDLVRALGVPATADLPHLEVQPDAVERVRALLAGQGAGEQDPLVVLHPEALNMEAKRWLPDRWAEVADQVRSRLGHRVVLVGSASETSLVKQLESQMNTSPVNLAGRTSIAELMALLSLSKLFLGGDSGPLHLASALGVPSVSIYGPTDPANTGPLGARATVLRGTAPCIPCYDLRHPPVCWRGDLLCMQQVTVEQVFAAAREALA